MKSWELAEDVRKDPGLAARVEQFRPIVENVVGASGPLVAARWSVAPAGDRRCLILNLADWTHPAGMEARFEPDELTSGLDTRWKVHRVWGDLLQARSHRLVADLLKEE